jgi:hypothetical protein
VFHDDHAGVRVTARAVHTTLPGALGDVGGFAYSGELPGVRIPGGPFMGVMGVAGSVRKPKRLARTNNGIHKVSQEIASTNQASS